MLIFLIKCFQFIKNVTYFLIVDEAVIQEERIRMFLTKRQTDAYFSKNSAKLRNFQNFENRLLM